MIFVFVVAAVCKTTGGFAQVNVQDSLALVALYDSTGGANWYNTWNLATPVNDWSGVSVINGRVISINFDIPGGNNLIGSIPSALGDLSNLTELDLEANELSGNIPASLGNLSNLTELDLAYNQLSGSIPAQLGSLSKLQELYLYYNELSGSIPATLGNLSNLQELDLDNNQLSSSIPPALGDLSNLEYLYLDHNKLSGTIPPQVGDLSNLTALWLNNNQLNHGIPVGFGNLFNLEELYLDYNKLTDSIPVELGNLSKLRFLALDSNQLSGSIPVALGNLSALTYLNLEYNQLSSSIPVALGDLSNLQELYLDHNQLSGSIPVDFGNLSNLNTLDLEYDQLSGGIPVGLGNLSKLTYLQLDVNQLSGGIPAELGNLSNLTWLLLWGNQLSGSIPSALGNLSNLTWLWLGDNQLSDSIPTTLDNFSNLTEFELEYNKFTFAGMEGIATAYKNIFDTIHYYPDYSAYAPQATIPLHYHGRQLSISAGGTLANDTYRWYKDNVLYETITGDSVLTVTTIGNYYVAVTNSIASLLTLFSDTVTITSLPVSLLSFTANKEGNKNLLQWATTQEINSSYFGVERSSDGVNFTSIGQVDAAGNSSLAKSYSLVDSKPVNGTDYYRLKMVDKDGQFSYSEVRSINEAVSFAVSIYPNPVLSKLNLNFNSDKEMMAEVEVVDNEGKVVAEQEMEVLAGLSMQSINVGSLISGSYYVRVVGSEGETEERFVKE